jgi:hypothetical protein
MLRQVRTHFVYTEDNMELEQHHIRPIANVSRHDAYHLHRELVELTRAIGDDDVRDVQRLIHNARFILRNLNNNLESLRDTFGDFNAQR